MSKRKFVQHPLEHYKAMIEKAASKTELSRIRIFAQNCKNVTWEDWVKLKHLIMEKWEVM